MSLIHEVSPIKTQNRLGRNHLCSCRWWCRCRFQQNTYSVLPSTCCLAALPRFSSCVEAIPRCETVSLIGNILMDKNYHRHSWWSAFRFLASRSVFCLFLDCLRLPWICDDDQVSSSQGHPAPTYFRHTICFEHGLSFDGWNSVLISQTNVLLGVGFVFTKKSR